MTRSRAPLRLVPDSPPVAVGDLVLVAGCIGMATDVDPAGLVTVELVCDPEMVHPVHGPGISPRATPVTEVGT